MRWIGWYCSREIGTSWRICKQSWWRYIGMLPCRSLQRRITTLVAACSHFKRTHTFLLFAWGAMFRNQLGALMKKPRSHHHWSWSPWQVEYYVKHRRYAFCSGDLTGFVSGSEQSINDGTVSRLLEETWTDSWNIQTMDWLCSLWCTRFIMYLLSYIIWTGNWNRKLQHWRRLVYCFMPFDRPMYLRLIPGHLADILQVLPAVLDHLCKAALWWGLKRYYHKIV